MPHLPKTSSAILIAFLAAVLLIPFSSSYFHSSFLFAYAQSNEQMTSDMSHLPAANIGNRQLALDFKTNPAAGLPTGKMDVNLSLIDKNTGNNVPHVTYTITITRESDGQQVFNVVAHGHDGKVGLHFVNDPSIPTYRVGANYDTLSASYISDFGSPIKVQGQVFSNADNYKTSIEVTGIDFDNTFLPQPLKYDFVIHLLGKQTLPIKYQDKSFEISAYSLIPIHRAELKAELRELVLSFDSSNKTTTSASNDPTINLEIPKELMSGPFTAVSGNGTVFDVKEAPSRGNATATTMITLTTSHSKSTTHAIDASARKSTSLSSSSQSPSPESQESTIIIKAANVIPEFPIALVGSVAALGFAAVIAFLRTVKFGNTQVPI